MTASTPNPRRWQALVEAVSKAGGRMGARWMMPVGDRAIALVGAARRLAAAADRGGEQPGTEKLRHHPMTYRSPEGEVEAQPDWSYQRRIITEAIHALGCLGWESADDQGPAYHRCRSVAGNVGAALHGWGQLIPDEFKNPTLPTAGGEQP